LEERSGGRTQIEVFLRLTRLGKSVEMRSTTTFSEALQGQLESVVYDAALSKQPMHLEARVEPDHVRIIDPSRERSVSRDAGPLLGPVAVSQLTKAQLRTPGDVLDYETFSPELQAIVSVRRRFVASGEHIACSQSPVARIEETVTGIPSPRTVWLDADGAVVADSISSPFGDMTTCRSTREVALAAEGSLPADLYEKTVARANVRLADSESVDRIVLRIRPRDQRRPLPAFSAHNQRVIEKDTRGVVVEVSRPSLGEPARVDTPSAEYLTPNAIVQSDDPEIERVAHTKAQSTSRETALALTEWTAEHMTMDAGIVMAPARELIRDRKGTCMGYATLLAALSRAAGIPSRVVMGYVYYGGVWGGHAWTEMWVDGHWLPFDAAVYAPGVASATRLAVGASDFSDGGGGLVAKLGSLFGQVDVEAIEYEDREGVHRVASGSSPYSIHEDVYENPGLGLRVRASGWQIENADSTWPSTLVVAFKRAETTIELHQLPRYPESSLPRLGEAMLIEQDVSSLFVWSVRGTGAANTLRNWLGRVERDE